MLSQQDIEEFIEQKILGKVTRLGPQSFRLPRKLVAFRKATNSSKSQTYSATLGPNTDVVDPASELAMLSDIPSSKVIFVDTSVTTPACSDFSYLQFNLSY
jgi:hypothetical protein